MDSVLNLPTDVLMSGVLPYLSIRDLQAVNVAFTSTPTYRARIKELWKSYPYECPDVLEANLDDLVWLKSVDMKPVGLVLSSGDIPGVNFVISNFPTLRRLVFDKIYTSSVSRDYFDDDVFIKLMKSCPLLEVVHSFGSEISDSVFQSLGAQLHTINIECYERITDAGIATMCSRCPHLKHIGLSNCLNLTDASLIAIANSYAHLEILIVNLDYCTDDGLIYLADKCHDLRTVSVRCDDITSRGLTALWAANPNLINVDISHNDNISDDVIIQLVQYCPLPQKLYMPACRRMTDAAVIAVAEHCPQLRSLKVRCCYEISDASLIALGQHCHELKSIDVSYLKNISDVGIAALAAGCPLLQEFYAYDSNITNAGVIALARGCRDLLKVNTMRCMPFDFRVR